MKKIILFSWLVLMFGCASAKMSENPIVLSTPTPEILKQNEANIQNIETVTVGKVTFKLENCRLSFQDSGKTQSYTFPISAPCQFSRNEDGSIRLVKVKKVFVIAIENSQPKNNPSDSTSKDCETSIRGVIVGKNSVKLSLQTQKVAMCLPFVWDEKMFIAFADKTVPFSE